MLKKLLGALVFAIATAGGVPALAQTEPPFPVPPYDQAAGDHINFETGELLVERTFEFQGVCQCGRLTKRSSKSGIATCRQNGAETRPPDMPPWSSRESLIVPEDDSGRPARASHAVVSMARPSSRLSGTGASPKAARISTQR